MRRTRALNDATVAGCDESAQLGLAIEQQAPARRYAFSLRENACMPACLHAGMG